MKELQNYVDGIRADLVKLCEADYTEEEREALEESGEAFDLWSYFADALDVEYTMNSAGEYIGARIFVTLGGPNVWVDTRDGVVGGAWGCDRATSWLPCEVCEEIDAIYSESFECLRA